MSALNQLNNQLTTLIQSDLETKTFVYGLGSDNLVLSGYFEVLVLQGSVLVNGIVLTENEKYTFAAPIAPYPLFKTRFSANNTNLKFPEFSSSAVLQIADLYCPNGTSGSATDFLRVPDLSNLAPPYKPLFHNLSRVESDKTIHIPQSWTQIDVDMSCVILGPKNSGKSSFARYLCNKSIKAGRQVYLLDIDPGQPEFAPPGVLALYKLNDINFAPPFAHPNVPSLKSMYFGYPSPMETPQKYLEMCKILISEFNKIAGYQDLLIVNTTGWTRGIGQDLNTELVDLVNPTVVVHMGESEFPFPTKDIESLGSGSTITAGGYSSAELRNLQLLTYFHLENSMHLTEWQPYSLGLGFDREILSINIYEGDGLDLEDWDIVIEGTIVGIGRCSSNLELPTISIEPVHEHVEFLGLGVVQYVNKASNEVRLLTHVSPQTTPIVLLRGRIQLPIFELQNKKFKSNISPWISSSKPVGIGGTYTKFRRNIQR